MPILKAPLIQPKNETIEFRVPQELKFRLTRYAEFIYSSTSYVVMEILVSFGMTLNSKGTLQRANRRQQNRTTRRRRENRCLACLIHESRKLVFCKLNFRSFGDSRACLGPAERGEVHSGWEKNIFGHGSTRLTDRTQRRIGRRREQASRCESSERARGIDFAMASRRPGERGCSGRSGARERRV